MPLNPNASERQLTSYQQLLSQIPERRKSTNDSLLKLRQTTACLPKGSKRRQEHLDMIKKMESMLKQIDVEEADLKYLIRTLKSSSSR